MRLGEACLLTPASTHGPGAQRHGFPPRPAAIVRDLLQRVLHINPDECFVTDESSLWDFHTGNDNQDYIRRIALLYEVDVSDLDPPTLVAIARRIHERCHG